MRLRYTSGNSTCSLIEFSSLLEYRASKNNRWFHWGQMLNKVLKSVQRRLCVEQTLTLLDRATSILCTDEEKTAEFQRLTATLKANGYPARFIDSCKPVNHAKDRGSTRNLVVLPYAKGASEKITRVLNQHNIKVAHKPVRTVGSFYRRPKDQPKKEDTRGTVYKIECNDCAAVPYIGQTSRA